MPIFEFECDCGAEFEELLPESQEYMKCEACGGLAKKKISAVAPIIKNSTRAEGIIVSPKELDKRVGEMCERRHQSLAQYKEKQEKVKKDLGTDQITKVGDTFAPMPKEEVNLRKKVRKIMTKGERTNPEVGLAKRKE